MMTLAAISFIKRGLNDTTRSLCAFSSFAGSLPAAADGDMPAGDHTSRTALNYRHNVVSEATVLEMKQESSTVKSLILKVHDNRVMFKAGQWVDVFLPNVDQVGGFSMYSSPKLLEETGTIKLAVKKSMWPPASWVHSHQCRPGIKINLRVGGDFYYEVPENSGTMKPDMLFIAGGVGINPLLSILQHVTPVITDSNTVSSPKNMTLLYSARTSEEILFKDVISEIGKNLPKIFHCQYFVTKEKNVLRKPEGFREGRISEQDLREVIRRTKDLNNLLCFLCGPPPMTDAFKTSLQKLGVPDKNIRFEKWW